MNKKTLAIVCFLALFSTVFQPAFSTNSAAIKNSKSDQKKLITKIEIIDENNNTFNPTILGDIVVVHWPNKDSLYPWNRFEVPLYSIGLETYDFFWDNVGDRNCWEFKQRLIWWTSSLNIDGEYTEDPYYDLDVDYYQDIEYGCRDGESFRYGGWNVEEAEKPGDYESWSQLLAAMLLFPFFAFPVKNFPLIRADSLLSALLGIEEEIIPEFTWDGSQIYDASGCLEHDFHVEPSTSFSKIFWFRFSSTPGNPFVKTIGIRFSGFTPGPPAELEMNPPNQNFGNIKVDKCSDEKSFTLKNEGITAQYVDVYLTNGHINHWEITKGEGHYLIEPEEEKTIKVKFCPESKGTQEIDLAVFYEGGNLTSNLFGNGEGLSKEFIKNRHLFKTILSRIFQIKILDETIVLNT